MIMYFKGANRNKSNESNIPNVLAFGFIRNFLSDRQYEQIRREYFINNLSTNQVNQAMKDLKWLFRTYKGLDIMTIENPKGDISKFIL